MEQGPDVDVRVLFGKLLSHLGYWNLTRHKVLNQPVNTRCLQYSTIFHVALDNIGLGVA